MTSYKDLGFVNTTEMFKKAAAGKYAVPAYNFNNMEQIQAIVTACVETQSPVILQVSSGARKYANQTLLQYMGQGAVEMMKTLAAEKGLKEIPIALHLDHGDTFELCKSCVDSGFSSVMIDGSHHSYEDNVALTKKVVEYAHAHDVTVEGELGMAIKKSGRTTGLTSGEITQVDVTVNVQYGGNRMALFTDQLMAGAMSQGGDSGSAVLTENNKLTGLLFAGSDTTTVINRIENVFTALGVTA